MEVWWGKRNMKMRRIVLSGTILLGVALVVVVLFSNVYRPWARTWGATEEEVLRAMPGDEIVPQPTFEATRAVTIDASPEQIWPWIIQIGYRRAGFYSYDRLDNDGIASAEQIIPEHQGLAVSDLIPLSRTVDAEVRLLEPGKFLVLVVAPPDTTENWTWAWGLYEQDSGQTRLITRLRVRAESVRANLMLDAFEIVMMRKHLRGIERRAEAVELGQ